MDITIAVASDQSEVDLRSLEQWLLQERTLRQVRFTRPAPVPRPGDMGAVSEILLASFGAGGVGAMLAEAISVWLQSRVAEIRVRVESPQGIMEVDARAAGDAATLLNKILQELPDAEGGSSPDGGSPADETS